jgi:histidinol dehydrogenase
VLVTASTELAAAVERQLEQQVPATKHSDRVAQALSGPQSAIVLVDDTDAGQEVVDAYAAEHLEIHTVDARLRATRIRNAGAIFVGPFSPVSLGDYCAGSNHVLPTGGCACHSSGLSVQTFLGESTSSSTTRMRCGTSRTMSSPSPKAEDLPAHGQAVTVRL